MFTPMTVRNPFSYVYQETKNSVLYKLYSKKWDPQYCTICCKKMDPTYMLVFNVHIASEHSVQVQFRCPSGCKRIYGWAYKKNVFLETYYYFLDEYKLSYFHSESHKPRSIHLTIGKTSSNIPFFNLEKMTKNGIIRRINRLVPFI
jgi:hypothetical protein